MRDRPLDGGWRWHRGAHLCRFVVHSGTGYYRLTPVVFHRGLRKLEGQLKFRCRKLLGYSGLSLCTRSGSALPFLCCLLQLRVAAIRAVRMELSNPRARKTPRSMAASSWSELLARLHALSRSQVTIALSSNAGKLTGCSTKVLAKAALASL